MHLENASKDNYGNEKNVNKELFLSIKNYLEYNIVWPGKTKIFYTKTNI